jgi:aspartate/methionine/tyrosine aminotransferase
MHGVATDDGRREQNIEVIPPLTSDDVIVANGVSGALELALTALLDEDSVLLGAYFCIQCRSRSCPVVC